MNNQPSHKQFQSIAPLSQKIFTTYMYLLAHPSPPPPPKKKVVASFLYFIVYECSTIQYSFIYAINQKSIHSRYLVDLIFLPVVQF